ncbi:hypothetical protein A3D77_05705 [Candidatus Gottesmanbacteria bacterium RIFCSPHIGHO2_02_FULL_39_11]|uniref:Uncharacterized protein n=1 Tax=Candidatus Gottesmanbacteria bacterium RIFCSPHIGHO2_02_FULL_39_11 TaxID=1798382 RepID=A0A1F5ZY46_9BACT|nr:MAG: hypothetical protein A3D77_05705 [Candidatus Gottesmanbacteria bacterium RIFCSPHIGHO2_02_FULL_39_11]
MKKRVSLLVFLLFLINPGIILADGGTGIGKIITYQAPLNNSVVWKTNTVSLTADNFYILIDGKEYYLGNNTIEIHSDPGNSAYTTLELTWKENSRDMRFYMYFNSDGKKWNVYEARTYNGYVNGDWIFYKENVLNFKGDVGKLLRLASMDIESDSLQEYKPYHSGIIHFENLTLRPFYTVNDKSQIYPLSQKPERRSDILSTIKKFLNVKLP